MDESSFLFFPPLRGALAQNMASSLQEQYGYKEQNNNKNNKPSDWREKAFSLSLMH